MNTNPVAAVISLAALVGSFLFISKFDNSTGLRPWSLVNSNAYVEIVNNTSFNLPVTVTAFEVDSAVRFLGIAKGCKTSKFKLPYLDTKVTVIVGVVSGEIYVDKPMTYGIILSPDSTNQYACHYITKPVWRLGNVSSELAWRNGPYYRIDDPPGEWPWLLIQATDETVCAAWGNDALKVPNPGDYYACKTKWRTARRW